MSRVCSVRVFYKIFSDVASDPKKFYTQTKCAFIYYVYAKDDFSWLEWKFVLQEKVAEKC